MISQKCVRVKVKTINGDVLEVNTVNTSTVMNVKESIMKMINKPVEQQRLIFHGKILKDNEGLFTYGIEDNDVVHLVVSEGRPGTPGVNDRERDGNSSGGNNNNNPTNDLLSYLTLLSVINNSINTISNTRMNRINNNNNSNNERNNRSHSTNVIRNINNINNNNNNNTNNNNNNNPHSAIPISDSFSHLLQPSNFNYYSSYENITQNINNIHSLLSNESSSNITKTLFTISNSINHTPIKFQLGQWVDVLDTFSHWTEAQIKQINIQTNKALIHYLGMSTFLDEWISLDSPRLALFRTHTIQSPFSRYFSPFPNKTETNLNNNVLHIEKCDEPLINLFELSEFIDALKKKIQHVLDDDVKVTLLDKDNNVDIKQKAFEEKKMYLDIIRLYPVMDRVGRLMLDYSMFLMNLSFKFFNENYTLFTNDLVKENESEYSDNDRNDHLRRKLFQYEHFTQVGVMRNNGEIAQAYRLTTVQTVNNNSNNDNSNNSNNSNSRATGGANFRQQREMNMRSSSQQQQQQTTFYPNRQTHQVNIIRNNNNINTIRSTNGLKVDYLNAITFEPCMKRKVCAWNQSNNVIQGNCFSVFHYNKKRVLTFETFTQTYPSIQRYMISNNVTTVEYTDSNNKKINRVRMATINKQSSNRIAIDAGVSVSMRKTLKGGGGMMKKKLKLMK